MTESKRHCLIVMLFMVMLNGCTAFRANELPLATDALINRPGPAKARIFTIWNTFDNASPASLGRGEEAALMAGYFRDSINQSKCCDIVQFKQQADIVVEATVQSYFTPWMIIPAMLNSGSLGVIPYWDNRRFNVVVTVTNMAGRKKTYKLSDGVLEVRWLPLIIVGPFFGPETSFNAVQKNLTNNLVYSMQNDHLLSPP